MMTRSQYLEELRVRMGSNATKDDAYSMDTFLESKGFFWDEVEISEIDDELWMLGLSEISKDRAEETT